MTTKEVFDKDKGAFSKFGAEEWFRYYSALNAEVPVDKVKDKPYFLKLSDGENECYKNSLEKLINERKSFPQAAYEVRYKDLD